MPNGNHGNGQGGGFGGGVPDPIPSPYNFVPLSSHVFFPGWAPQVSMDVPFSDGISGTLQLKVTARTPIYIRNGGAHPEGNSRLADDNYTNFFRVTDDGPYAVPGTSLKGMLRSVIEIASFGKIVGSAGKAGRVSDHRYAVRDLNNRELYSHYFVDDFNSPPKTLAGFLFSVSTGEETRWLLRPCEYARIEQAAIHPGLGVGGTPEPQPAKAKYEFLEQQKISLAVSVKLSPAQKHDRCCGIFRMATLASACDSSATGGTIVLTGQPSPRYSSPGRDRDRKRKHLEFLFHTKVGQTVDVTDLRKDFEFVHSELGQNRQPNPEWAYWKALLNRGAEVPVFYLTGNNLPASPTNAPKSMGLAMMFRLPYANSIHQTIEHTSTHHFDGSQFDLAELIFGRVEDKDGLRGRVSIETLLAVGLPESEPPVTTVLGGPKPTYYPNYVKQPISANGTVERYQTYMDKNAEIRGWKRYIVSPDSKRGEPIVAPGPHGKERKPDPAPSKDDGTPTDLATRFCPLPAETAFTGTIHVHNLRPKELGALVWAITWGGDTGLRHSLGMGKPYGFGSVTVEIIGSDLRRCNPNNNTIPVTTQMCMTAFTNTMQEWWESLPGQVNAKWDKSPQLRALRIIANPKTDWPHEVRYPSLDDGEFADAKKKHMTVQACPPAPAPGPQAPKPLPAEKLPADKFLEELDRLSIGDIPKRIKSLGLDPGQVDPEKRKLIFSKLKKKPGAENWNFKPILNSWNPG